VYPRAPIPDPLLLQTFLALTFQQEQERRRSVDAQSKQRTQGFAAVLNILRAVATSEFELHDVLAFLAEGALAIADAGGAAIALEVDSEIRCVARTGDLAPVLGARVLPNLGVSGECISTGRAVYCSDAESDPRVNSAAIRDCSVRSVMAAPVCSDRGVIGLVEILSSQRVAFSDRERDVVEVLAAVAAQVVRIHGALEMRPTADSSEPLAAEKETIKEAIPPAETSMTVAATPTIDAGVAALDERAAAAGEPEPNLVVTVYSPPLYRHPYCNGY
jgi:transcriptional regulator with GAF, ATPase, and Fis domain